MIDCSHAEEQLAGFVEGTSSPAERTGIGEHLGSCGPCRELEAALREVLAFGADFPQVPSPEWLAPRIMARTPPVVRERWRDTLLNAWRLAVQPRMAMTVFASVFVLGWVSSVLGMPLNVSDVVRNPSGALYSAEGLVNQVYDRAVRSYYRSEIVQEIYCRIEQLRESPE
jgi:anti-sigma factor RsiW